MTLNSDSDPSDQLDESNNKLDLGFEDKDDSDLFAQVFPTKLSDSDNNNIETLCGTITGIEPSLETHEKLFLNDDTFNLFRTSLASHSRAGNKFMLQSVLPSLTSSTTYEHNVNTLDIKWPLAGQLTANISSTSTTQLGFLIGNNLSSLRDATQTIGFVKTEAPTLSNVPNQQDPHLGKTSADQYGHQRHLDCSKTKSTPTHKRTHQSSSIPSATKKPKANPSSPSGFLPVKSVGSDKQLIEAARRGDYNQVRQLVSNHCGLYSSDWSGTTALHVAAQNGHKDIVEILLNEGANQDARTKVERTALHLAAQYGHLPVVDLLISYWSDVNATDMLKMSPLHWATDKGHVNVVERLLQAGADATLRSKFQLTPLDIAYNSHLHEMIDMFKRYTSDISSPLCPVKQEPKQLASNESKNESHFERSEEQSCLTPVHSVSMSHDSDFDLEESCFDFMEFDWSKLEVPADFLLQNESEDGEPQIEYLMKVVEKLQRENTHLRLKVEQLSSDG